MSVGTMIPALLLLSDRLKKFYIPSYEVYENVFTKNITERIEIKKVEIDSYYKEMSPWRNTECQRNKMLTFKID
jgi:hypothetical protein